MMQLAPFPVQTTPYLLKQAFALVLALVHYLV